MRVGQIGGLGLHPEDVGERRGGQRLGNGVRDAAADLVVAFRRLHPFAVPCDVGAQLLRLFPRGVQRRLGGELAPIGGAHLCRLTLPLAEVEQVPDGLAVGLQAGIDLPDVDELRLDLVEQRVDRIVRAVLPRLGGLGNRALDAVALQPCIGGGVLTFG